MISWVAYLSIGILIGFATGFYFSVLNGSEKKKLEELKSKLNETENEMTQYKQSVTGHFVKTSNLINNMTDSYRAIYDHMSDGAKTLCSQSLIDSPAGQYQQLDIPIAKLIETKTDIETDVETSIVSEPETTNEILREEKSEETSKTGNALPIEAVNNQAEESNLAKESTENDTMANKEKNKESTPTDSPSHETLADGNNFSDTISSKDSSKKNIKDEGLEKKPMLYEKNKKQDSTVVH